AVAITNICAAAMTNAPMAIARSQPGRLHSSESLLFRDIQTDRPHSGQRRASRILRRLYPQRMQGFSRALGSLLMRTRGIAYEKYSGIPPLDRHPQKRGLISPDPAPESETTPTWCAAWPSS